MIQNRIDITEADFNRQELGFYARLTENQLLHYYEPDPMGLFIAESPKTVERALDAGYEPQSALVETSDITGEAAEVLEHCEKCRPGIPVFTADSDTLTKLLHFKMLRGMLCLMRRKKLPSMDEVIQNTGRIAILENVMNPTNVGAIFRSAAALGMDAVLLTRGCSDPLYRRSIRVSMGTVFQIPWTYMGLSHKGKGKAAARRAEQQSGKEQILQPGFCAWPQPALSLLGDAGFRTAALALREDSVSPDDPALAAEEKLAVILGTEGDGLAADTIADCDYTVRIPMAHGVDSLNVAAASAVAFWELRKK